MSFEEIWQENKSFILTLAAGLLVFLTAYLVISGSFEDEILANKASISASNRRIASQKIPAGKKSAVEQELEQLERRLARTESELVFRPGAGFTLAGVSRAPDIHFNETVQGMLSGVVEAASSLDIRIPTDLGLAGVTPRTNAEREWYLNGLDIVNRICLSAMAAQVASVDPIQIGRPPKKDRRERTKPYAREIVVTFSATGEPQSMDRLMRGLLLPGAQLAVEGATVVSLDQPDSKKKIFGSEELVRLDMKVKALLLETDGEPHRFRGKRF